MIWRYRFVHCVPACTSPVAVRVAVHAGSSIRAGDQVSAVGQGTTEVGVVVAVEHSRSRISIQYHKMWESLTRRGDAPRSEPLVALRRRSMQRILYMEFREFPTSTH